MEDQNWEHKTKRGIYVANISSWQADYGSLRQEQVAEAKKYLLEPTYGVQYHLTV